jgi:hypothetical protein
MRLLRVLGLAHLIYATEDDIKKMMDFLIVFVVFGDRMLQQTTYNKSKQTMLYYLLFITINQIFEISKGTNYRIIHIFV